MLKNVGLLCSELSFILLLSTLPLLSKSDLVLIILLLMEFINLSSIYHQFIINLSSIYHRLSFTSIEIFIISSSSLMKFNSLFQFITYTYHLNTNFIKISSNFTEISTNHRLISMITWSTRWWKHFKTHTFCCMKQQLKNGQNERIYRKTNWYIHRSNWHSEFLSKWWTFIVIWINIL